MGENVQLFENQPIRAAWDEEQGEWYFSVVDVVGVLTEQKDYDGARNYWKVLKSRIKDEGGQLVTKCNQLKMKSPKDGKNYKTDVADTEQLFRIIQSIPSPKAEPFKMWLAQVGRERIDISTSTPTLETDRLRLRPFQKEDAEDVFECWESDPDVAKYMFWTSHNNIDKTREWIAFELGQIEKPDWYRFAIVLRESNTLIGTALVYYEEEVACWEIGYNLGKKYWGKGYTTEAMEKVIDFAEKKLKLPQIVGRYAKENPASGNVMKKLGFQYEKDIPYECNDGAVKREGIQCRLFLKNNR